VTPRRLAGAARAAPERLEPIGLRLRVFAELGIGFEGLLVAGLTFRT
jgi:hypothetical protein